MLTFSDDGLFRHFGLCHLLCCDVRLHCHYGAHVWPHYRLLLHVANDRLCVLAGALNGLYDELLLHYRLLDQLRLYLFSGRHTARETAEET